MLKQTRLMFLAALAALTMSACGGGSLGGPDEEPPPPPTGPVPESLTLLASSPQLSSDADDPSKGVTLTAIVKDQNNVVMPNVDVEFSTQDVAELTVPSPAVTDSRGRVEATVSTGGDPTNRSITVSATAGTLTRSITIQVIGTSLDISGPSATQINASTPYTAVVTDASGAGIPNVSVSLSTNPGNTLTPTSGVTNSAGQMSFTLRATVANTTISASALAITTTKSVTVSTDEFSFTQPPEGTEIGLGTSRPVQVRWFRDGRAVPDGTVVNFTATRGTLSAATATTVAGLASVSISSKEAGFSVMGATGTLSGRNVATTRTVEFVAIRADKVDVQASPANIATNESSEITAVVRDPTNNLVKNATVQFSLQDRTAGNLSASSAVTNSQGVAKVTYTASSQASATEGVVITGTVLPLRAGDPPPAQPSDTAKITVGARAVDITIGTGAEIINKDESTYQLPFTVLVSDSSGNPVPDAKFTLSYVPTRFRKGTLFGGITATCDNEDIAPQNDIMDVGEDIDNDGQLEPGRVATVPSEVPLASDGSAQFLLTYPKDRGVWVEVAITGTATVAGTSTSETRTIWLRIAEDDVENLPNESPYGVEAGCANPN